MEGLRKLEEMQKTMMLMESHGLVSPKKDSDSERFVANLIRFLIQPCGQLDMDKKLHLISEHLPKISSTFLEEVIHYHHGEGYEENLVESTAWFHHDKKTDNVSQETNSENMPTVGLEAMQRANSTLEDFCRSYFMFHEMDVNNPKSVFRYLPVLSFTESYIYQLDGLNEKMLHVPTNAKSADTIMGSQFDLENRCWNKFMEVFKDDLFKPLVLLLENHGILTERIREELRYGEEYWALERKLCSALISNKKIRIQDVMRAIYLKSFDYRVLNLLLYQLRGQKVNDLHMEFLSASEFLVEVSDDLFDYEDDVLENSFNILRMFVSVYGASVASTMLAKTITEAEERYEHLLTMLDPQLSLNYQRRCEEATKEGGKKSGNSFGTWNIPSVIADEESYRINFSNSKSPMLSQN